MSRWHRKHKRRCKTAAHMCFVLCRGFSRVSVVPSPNIWPLGDAFLTASCVFVIRKSEGIVQSRSRRRSHLELRIQPEDPAVRAPPPSSPHCRDSHTSAATRHFLFVFFSTRRLAWTQTLQTSSHLCGERERESPAADRAENKNTYVTSPLAEEK